MLRKWYMESEIVDIRKISHLKFQEEILHIIINSWHQEIVNFWNCRCTKYYIKSERVGIRKSSQHEFSGKGCYFELEMFFICQLKKISPVLCYPVPGNASKMSGLHGNSGIRKYTWNMVFHTEVLYQSKYQFFPCD